MDPLSENLKQILLLVFEKMMLVACFFIEVEITNCQVASVDLHALGISVISYTIKVLISYIEHLLFHILFHLPNEHKRNNCVVVDFGSWVFTLL